MSNPIKYGDKIKLKVAGSNLSANDYLGINADDNNNVGPMLWTTAAPEHKSYDWVILPSDLQLKNKKKVGDVVEKEDMVCLTTTDKNGTQRYLELNAIFSNPATPSQNKNPPYYVMAANQDYNAAYSGWRILKWNTSAGNAIQENDDITLELFPVPNYMNGTALLSMLPGINPSFNALTNTVVLGNVADDEVWRIEASGTNNGGGGDNGGGGGNNGGGGDNGGGGGNNGGGGDNGGGGGNNGGGGDTPVKPVGPVYNGKQTFKLSPNKDFGVTVLINTSGEITVNITQIHKDKSGTEICSLSGKGHQKYTNTIVSNDKQCNTGPDGLINVEILSNGKAVSYAKYAYHLFKDNPELLVIAAEDGTDNDYNDAIVIINIPLG